MYDRILTRSYEKNNINSDHQLYNHQLEMMERKLMEDGKLYSDAYESAVQMVKDQRKKMESIAGSHLKVAIPDYLARDAGVIDPAEK